MEVLRRAATLLLVAAVAALLLGSTSVAGQDPGLEGPDEPRKEGVTYEWWDDEWHMRVPVLVRPQMPDHVVEDRRPVLEDVEDVPVHVEIDFTDVIRRIGDSPDAKWPQEVGGSLDSFTFDTDSVRVVRYDRDSGTIKTHGRTGDVVPTLFNPTLHERRDLRNDRFDPSANAVGTVTWIAEGTLDAPRLYFVYFDIEENGDKAPLDLTPEERGALDSLRWIRPGTDAYGYIPAKAASTDNRPALEVYGLYEDTAVRVAQYTQSGFDPLPLKHCNDSDTGLCVEADRKIDGADEPAYELQPLWEGYDESRLRVESRRDVGFHFRVTADKPVLVASRQPDAPSCPVSLFYPGQQGLVSTEFTFVNLANPPSSQVCGEVDVRIVAPTDSARVTWTWLDSFVSQTVTVPKRGSAQFELPSGSAGRPVYVEASDPVAIVQPGKTTGFHGVQAPSAHGAPFGDRVLAPLHREIRAVPWSERAEVTTFDTQNPGEDAAEQTEVGGPGPGHPAFFGLQHTDFKDFRGNIWETSAGGADVAAYHGARGLMPIGGDEGMDLRVPLSNEEPDDGREPERLILYPPYERTEVTVTRNATGETIVDDTLGLDEFLDRDADGRPFVAGPGGVHVESSKPLLALQANKSVGYTYYPTITRGPLYTVGEAEFHGHLIRWDKPLRTPTMAPGQEDRFTLSLTNLGRRIGGGNLADDIVIEQEVSKDWDVTLTTQKVAGLASFESRDVTVAVSIPEEAETGQTLVVNLTAISQGNPEFEAFSQIKITLQTLFDVELTFRDEDCNPKSCERLVDAGDSTLYGLRVNNSGTGDDEYTFSISESQSGFEGRVEHENGTVLATSEEEEARDTLAVPRGEDAVAFVNVTAPDDASVAFPYEAVIQAKSESDSRANSQVVATTVLSVNTNFRIEAGQEARPITPGETTTFPVRVVNEGDDTVLDVETSEPSLGGWNISVDPASFLLRANGTTAPDGTRGDVRTVDVNVTAAEDARVGEILPLEVTVLSRTAQGTTAEESTRVRAIVANNFTLAKSGLEPRSLQPGETFRYQFNVRNAANGPFTTTVNATGLPEGWTFEKETPTSPTELEVGDSLDVDGDLVLPPGTPSGLYNVTFSFFSETPEGDRGVTNATGLVQVSRRSNLQVEAPADVQHVPPGNVTRVPLDVTNAGNVEMTARLDLRAPEDWTVTFRNESQSRLPLEPGESEEVDVLLGAPAEIGDGPVTWGVDADLPLRDVQRFDLAADWIRTDLTVADVQAVTPTFETGETSVLAVTVRNDGSLPANNVDLAVVVDGEPAENVTIGTLPPNEDRVVQVPWTVAPYDDSLEVVIDPFDRFVETDETNNAHPFSPRSESAVPAPGPAVAALAAAGAALARRRWTP